MNIALLLWFQRFVVGRSGGPEAAQAAARALRQHRVPPGVDRWLLRRALLVQRSLAVWTCRVWTPVLLVAAGAMGWVAIRDDMSEAWMLGGVLAAIGTATHVGMGRRIRLADAFVDELDARSAADPREGPAGHPPATPS